MPTKMKFTKIFLRKFEKVTVLIVFLMLRSLPLVKATVFVTIANMEILLYTQKVVIDDFKMNLEYKQSKNMGNFPEIFIDLCEREHDIAMEDPTRYLQNPINSYTLLKRMSVDLQYAEEQIMKYSPYRRTPYLKYPTPIDFSDACDAIINLIVVYELNVSDLANGTLIGKFSETEEEFIEYASPMSSCECYKLAETAFKHKEYEIALVWAKEAYNRFSEDSLVYYSISELVLMKYISKLYYILDDMSNAIRWTEKTRKLLTFRDEVDEYQDTITILWRALSIQHLEILKAGSSTPYYAPKKNEELKPLREILPNNTRALCQGVLHDFSLYCEYRFGPHPFLRLAGLKAEVLHLNPEVTMLHDVISDREIDLMRELTQSWGNWGLKLQHVHVKNVKLKHIALPELTSSKRVATLMLRALDISGLTTAMEEKTKFIDYGVGGYQSYLDKNYVPAKATVVYYLTNVNQGGATVFSKLNLTVFPRKNSALLWRTDPPSGDTERELFHADCPVLHGQKLVITKSLLTADIINKFISKPCGENTTNCDRDHSEDLFTKLNLINYDILNKCYYLYFYK